MHLFFCTLSPTSINMLKWILKKGAVLHQVNTFEYIMCSVRAGKFRLFLQNLTSVYLFSWTESQSDKNWKECKDN